MTLAQEKARLIAMYQTLLATPNDEEFQELATGPVTLDGYPAILFDAIKHGYEYQGALIRRDDAYCGRLFVPWAQAKCILGTHRNFITEEIQGMEPQRKDDW